MYFSPRKGCQTKRQSESVPQEAVAKDPAPNFQIISDTVPQGTANYRTPYGRGSKFQERNQQDIPAGWIVGT